MDSISRRVSSNWYRQLHPRISGGISGRMCDSTPLTDSQPQSANATTTRPALPLPSPTGSIAQRRSHECLHENTHPRNPFSQTPCFSVNTASYASNDAALNILSQLSTPSSILFDPQFTSRQKPSPAPPFRTFPPSPTTERRPPQVPSTISLQNLESESSTREMDKRHPSSFQQLEKLGEGTYATVSA